MTLCWLHLRLNIESLGITLSASDLTHLRFRLLKRCSFPIDTPRDSLSPNPGKQHLPGVPNRPSDLYPVRSEIPISPLLQGSPADRIVSAAQNFSSFIFIYQIIHFIPLIQILRRGSLLADKIICINNKANLRHVVQRLTRGVLLIVMGTERKLS